MSGVLCLLYHRVDPIKDQMYQLTVSPEHFEQHIKFIKEQYSCKRFEEEWESGTEPSVVITFDDGYADNYLYALPILEKYKVPATVFVATGNIGTMREFWWDELGRLFTEGKDYPDCFTLEDSMFHYTWETDTLEKRIELAKTLRWLLRMEPDISIRNKWFQQIRVWAGITETGRTQNYSMTVEELVKMYHSGVITIGAHTVNHMSLGSMGREQQLEEIRKSMKDIENWTGAAPTVFSYPFGLETDFNEDTVDICKELGIQKAATTNQKLWNPNFGRYEIPRKTVRDWDIEVFEEQISQWWRIE